MKNKLINYLIILTLLSYLIFSEANIFVSAQSLDYPPNEIKVFGSSLKKTDKKKKDSAKTEKQNNRYFNENNPINEDGVIRVETTLVVNEVLVFDKNGKCVQGLKKEDFMVKEDNQPQEITTFLTGDSELIPRSIVLIIDYSFSQLPYLETSIEAAKVLVDKLNQNDRMAIVTDNVELLQGFTSDKKLLKDKLEALKISAFSGEVGSSKQYSALMTTLNEMFNEQAFRPIIIFQTDGDQLGQLKGEVANHLFLGEDAINFSYQDILTGTDKTRATIYTIIPGIFFKNTPKKVRLERAKTHLEKLQIISTKLNSFTLQPHKPKMDMNYVKSRAEWIMREQEAISEIAKFTGGWTKYLEEPQQAEKIYSEILSKMNERYVIGYSPTNQAREQKIRLMTTEVRGHPEYKIVGRKSYLRR